MSSRQLVEEGKKRIVFLVVSVVGLSYLMSLTSSNVLINLPAASFLIIILRYFALDYDTRRKNAAYNNRPPPANNALQKKPVMLPDTVGRSEWRGKVNSPVVEEALENFTRHLVSEFVTDLWYSRLTPDKQGPGELMCVVNSVLGELSARFRNMNLIDLLTRDLISLICSHLELFRIAQAKIPMKNSGLLTIEKRDMELRLVLLAENKLHPALFSADAEHKVLQHLMDGLISFTFKREDLECTLFRYIVRELLACAVIRPVLNLATPRFINERIEQLVVKMNEPKSVNVVQEESQSKQEELSNIPSDHFSTYADPSVTGVELVQLKNGQSRTSAGRPAAEKVNGIKYPLLSVETSSSRPWNSLRRNSQSINERVIERHSSGEEWGDVRDRISHRKTQALAPENFDNMWAKGRDYRRMKGKNMITEQVSKGPSEGKLIPGNHIREKSDATDKAKLNLTFKSGSSNQVKGYNSSVPKGQNIQNHASVGLDQEDDELSPTQSVETDSGSSTYISEDGESDGATGLDSPGTKVWDGRSIRGVTSSHIHHPLENSGCRIAKRSRKGNLKIQRSRQKKSATSDKKSHVWQDIERTSFLSGDGKDILQSQKGHAHIEDSTDDSENEKFGRINSGAATSSSAPFRTLKSMKSSLATDTFFKLKCEVSGANIVKSGATTFAVYAISVTDANGNSWSIKRRYRHFEELHRRLKEFPQYTLHLPPKSFLSTGLDLLVVQERCKLLDKYIKELMMLPTISGSIEVWDFLSVDSQTYLFTKSFSIIDTLSVSLDDKQSEKSNGVLSSDKPVIDSSSLKREKFIIGKDSTLQVKNNALGYRVRLAAKGILRKPLNTPSTYSGTKGKNQESSLTNAGKTSADIEEQESELFLDAATDPTLPTEWVPPNVSVPILDLVDVIFQLQDGGWIRRQAFWVAKQILQLGMSDTFDDWLIEKIQLLRKGSIVASGIRLVEQILWPDGIFISKHPKRKPQPTTNLPLNSPQDLQQQDVDRRAKLVYELMIDNAPAAIVSLVGTKEYDKCAKDLYYFLQSSVCLKQLAYELIELLLSSAFPELEDVLKQMHEEKHKFAKHLRSHTMFVALRSNLGMNSYVKLKQNDEDMKKEDTSKPAKKARKDQFPETFFREEMIQYLKKLRRETKHAPKTKNAN